MFLPSLRSFDQFEHVWANEIYDDNILKACGIVRQKDDKGDKKTTKVTKR